MRSDFYSQIYHTRGSSIMIPMEKPFKPKRPFPKGIGFTLVELLVVIAIIGLLIAILVPTLRAARRSAMKTLCLSNLKQWGVVLDIYTSENDEHFFRGMMDGWWNDWIEILKPLYGDRGPLTFCPFAKKTGPTGPFSAWIDEEGDSGSYGLNAWVCDADPGGIFDEERYWRTTQTGNTNNIPVFLDCMGIASWPDASSIPPEYNGQGITNPSPDETMKPFCIDRHGNAMTNCLFMDWSVREVGLKELWRLNWHKGFDMNGPWTKYHIPPPQWPDWMKPFKDY